MRMMHNLFWKVLILCSVLISGIMQHCAAMNEAPIAYTIYGKELIVHPISKLLEEYKKVKELGFGTYGKVFLMHNKEKNISIALKISSDISLVKEAIFLQMLKGNERIVQSYGIFYKDVNEKRIFCLALEYAPNGTLLELMDKLCENCQYIKESELREYAKQIMEALIALNKIKIMHLDLKPSNIVLTKDNKIKIIDFGVAQMYEGKDLDKSGINDYIKSIPIKDTGFQKFYAPETGVYYSKSPYGIGLNADLWSFGHLLYSLVDRTMDFPIPFNDARTEIIVPFPCNDTGWKSMSKELKDLIKNLLVYNPDKRLSLEQIKNHPWFGMNK